MFVRCPNFKVTYERNRWALSHTKVRKIKCKPTLVPFPCCTHHNSNQPTSQSNILYHTTQYSVHIATFHPHPNKGSTHTITIQICPLETHIEPLKYTKRKPHKTERKDCERKNPTVLMFAIFRYIFPSFSDVFHRNQIALTCILT